MLEDRLRAHLQTSGGETIKDKKGHPKRTRMMGQKTAVIGKRSMKDAVLTANFEDEQLNKWAASRNKLTHAMADGTTSVQV